MVLKVNLAEFFPIMESDDYIINQDGVIYRLSNNRFITTKDGVGNYPRVNLVFDGKRVTRAIHRLLAEAFIPKDESRDFVNHINGNKQDYSLSNLEWCTRSENQQHAIDNGLWVVSDKHRESAKIQGKKMGKANQKVSDEVVLSIREDVKTMPGKEVAVKYNISPATVSWIKNRKGNYAD